LGRAVFRRGQNYELKEWRGGKLLQTQGGSKGLGVGEPEKGRGGLQKKLEAIVGDKSGDLSEEELNKKATGCLLGGRIELCRV